MGLQPRRIRRVLFVSPERSLREATGNILRSAGFDLDEVDDVAAAHTWLRMRRAEIVVIDENAVTADRSLAEVRRDADRLNAAFLVLTRTRGPEAMRTVFQHDRIANFLAVDQDDRVDPVALTATVTKIVDREIFGLQHYLAPGAQELTIRVRSSSQKDEVVEQALAFALDAGCHQQIAQGLATAADELVTNALYNAPVDAQGNHLHQHLSRTVAVTLEPGDEVIVTLGQDGRRLGLSTTDPFGSLNASRVLDYLSKCFRRGQDQVDDKAGGAGLGLYFIFNLVQHFVLNLEPGTRTEVIGLLEITKSYRRFASRGKSFNAFVLEGR